MNHFLKTTILATAVAATTLAASLPAANAGERWRHYGGHRDRTGDVVAAGVLGLAVGALAAGAANAASQPRYYEPVDPYYEPDYVEPRYSYARRPAPIYAGRYDALEPWSPEWYRYCSDRYRSFNPRSGTFTGYDGMQHFCTAG